MFVFVTFIDIGSFHFLKYISKSVHGTYNPPVVDERIYHNPFNAAVDNSAYGLV